MGRTDVIQHRNEKVHSSTKKKKYTKKHDQQCESVKTRANGS